MAEHRITVQTSPRRIYKALLEPWARELLQQWMEVRAAMGIQHEMIFCPLTDRARRAGKLTQHPSHFSVRVSAFLNKAGILDPRACPQTLRNSFAATLFDRKESVKHICLVMGHETRYATERLRAAYYDFCNSSGAAQNGLLPPETPSTDLP